MTDSTSKIESRAGRLLQKFDNGMYRDYIQKTNLFRKTYDKNKNDLPIINFVNDKIVTGDLPIFYTKFNEPVYLIITNPLSMFRKYSGGFAGKKGSEHFFFQYGLIPVYFASMNTMSMLKLYHNRAEKLFKQSSNFFDSIKCLGFTNKKGDRDPNHVKFSSMNIIEQSYAQECLASETISNWLYDKYFKYGFWLQPRKGFTPSTHIGFGKKMNTIYKLAKSIYVIDQLGTKEKITISGNEIEVYNADVRGVWVDRMNFGKSIKIKIEASIYEKLSKNEHNEIPLLNGILMEIRSSKNKNIAEQKFEKILTVSASTILSYFDMICIVSGMLCYRTCINMNVISRISTAKGFQENVERICKDWIKEIKFSDSLSDKIDNVFQTAIDMLFPMIIVDDSSVYFTNPLIIGFLKKWDLISNSIETQKSTLLLLLPLLEKISKASWQERIKITREKNYRELIKLVKNDPTFTSSLIKLVKEIHMSNLIRKTYQTEFLQ